MKTDCVNFESDKPSEECAVFGISTKSKNAVAITYNALLALQHRGQEGSGIAFNLGNKINCVKGTGLVSDVFKPEFLENPPNSGAVIGHNRYSTTGCSNGDNVQPFIAEYFTGRIAAAHNGNITNSRSLREGLGFMGVNFDATSDSEVLLNTIAYYAVKYKNVKDGVLRATERLRGAYSVVVLCDDGSIIAFRDPDGFRPLSIGENKDGIAVASETCAFDSCGFSFKRDILPGEVVVIKDGNIISSEFSAAPKTEGNGLCVFEYVYFSRPDSFLDGLSVYKSRWNMGAELFKEHPADADMVCGVPDSGLDAAAGFAHASGIPLGSAFVKNRYIGRSFIYPTDSERQNAVRLKLNPLSVNVEGKSIVLIDDSIVRGTTCGKIVNALKSAGALKVHLRISSPPFINSCLYGTDIGSENNLMARKMSIEQIRRKIGADSLGFISVNGLVKACGGDVRTLCTKCFTHGESFHQSKDIFEKE